MKSILEFKEIHFGWRRHASPLFPSLNLAVPEGAATALLGPNGAGKTTLMDLALGWRTPQKGDILLRGTPVTQWSSRKRGRFMALVPQDESVPFEYSVLEYILLGRAPHLPLLGTPSDQDRRIAEESLEETGISHLASRKISRLSGGEKQLVLLARALTQQPSLLLLDEPASHLDLRNRDKIIRILEKLTKRGISLFFTSHDPEVVLRLSGHVVLLKKGQIVHSGPSDSILTESNLASLYDIPVRMGDVDGRKVLVWGEKEK